MSKLPELCRFYIGEDAVNSFMARGNTRPSGYAEYDGLTGYVACTYVAEWMDTDGTRWRKTVQWVNLGRGDRAQRAPAPDPDAQLTPEKWGHEHNGNHDPTIAYETHRKIAAARRMALQKRVVAFLVANGPSVAHCIAEGIDCKYNSLKSHFHQHAIRVAAGEEELVYCEVGNAGRATIWGVYGFHAPEKGAT